MMASQYIEDLSKDLRVVRVKIPERGLDEYRLTFNIRMAADQAISIPDKYIAHYFADEFRRFAFDAGTVEEIGTNVKRSMGRYSCPCCGQDMPMTERGAGGFDSTVA